MQTSWRTVLAFSHFVNGFVANGQQYQGWLALHPEESKLSYAIKRIADQIVSLDKIKQVEFENIDIDNCATDERKVIIRNADGSLAFTQEGLKARNLARTALLDSDVEIEPHYCNEIPETMRAEERKILTGFVIQESKLEAVA